MEECAAPCEFWRHNLSDTSTPPLSHDSTFKSLFRHRAVIEDLLVHFLPELQGYRPTTSLSTEVHHVDAEHDPRLQRRHSDLVWLLEGDSGRVLLVLEHQSGSDLHMTERMYRYMDNALSTLPDADRGDLRVYPLVFGAGPQHFGTWTLYRTDSSNLLSRDKAGPLIDIHDYPFPTDAAFGLPTENLMTIVIALERLQWALRASSPGSPSAVAAYGKITAIVEQWLKPRLPAASSELGDAFAVWLATGMQNFLRSWPTSRRAIADISHLTFAALEQAMITVQDLVQEGIQEGRREGIQEGRLDTLTDYVRMEWGDEVATDFWNRLAAADVELPTLADLQGRRLRQEPPLPRDTR